MTNEKNKEEFPGYPHYPAKEDIMNSKENERVNVDMENLSRSKKPGVTPEIKEEATMETITTETEERSEADVTPEEIAMLDSTAGEDAQLLGDELDVPGAEEDDENEKIGEEDEENNYYSIGGDAHENLEEDKGE